MFLWPVLDLWNTSRLSWSWDTRRIVRQQIFQGPPQSNLAIGIDWFYGKYLAEWSESIFCSVDDPMLPLPLQCESQNEQGGRENAMLDTYAVQIHVGDLGEKP